MAIIDKIRFVTKDGVSWGKNRECPQDEAEDYQLILRPIKSTGDISFTVIATGEPYYEHRHRDKPLRDDELVAKTKTVQLVKNVVKL